MTHRAIHRIASVSAVLLALAQGCASAVDRDAGGDVAVQDLALQSCPPAVPAAIAVPEGNRLGFAFDAVGQQIYVCQLGANGLAAWTLKEPDADLFKPNGTIAGSHYFGPTWEGLDGSTVVGARVAGVTPDPTAIPHLLLRAISNSEDGRFSNVTFIHRLETVGGLAPTTGCDAEHVGALQGVDYTAVYYFYVPSHGQAQGSCDP